MFKTAPFPYQRRIFELSKDFPFCALLMDMGTGKSKVLIDTMCHLRTENKIDCVLVVCPKGVMPAWTEQLTLHTWDSIMLRIAACRAESLHRKHGREQLLLIPSHPKAWAPLRVAIMPVSLLAFKSGVDYAHQFLISGKSMMVIDESTSIKNPKAKRTQAVLGWRRTKARAAFVGLASFATYRRIATGMPVTQSPLDLWSQFEFLQKGCLGFGSYYSFRAQFADLVVQVLGTRAFKKVVGYRSLDILQKRMGLLSFRVTKEEALPHLPPKIYTTYNVELTSEQEKMYRDMRNKAVARWSCGAEVSAPIALTQILRMQEILCGYTREDENDARLPVKSNRLGTLLEILEGVSGKLIIWAPFTWALGDIRDALYAEYGTDSTVMYQGETTQTARKVAIDLFQTDPACRFFVGNPSAGGKGLTLTAAHTVVYYANSHSVEDRCQSEDRAHRIGQHNAVTYIDMVAGGTVDGKLLAALKDKRSLADLVVNGGIEDVI